MALKIAAVLVKELRDKTGIAMGQCKKALEQTEGDVDAAIKVLREKMGKKVQERSGRDASEGVIAAALSEDRKFGALVQLSSETDFVSRNLEFQELSKAIANAALAVKATTVEEALLAKLDSGKTAAEAIEDIRNKIGEKIEVAKYESAEADVVTAYIHPPGKIGVLVAATGSTDNVAAASEGLRGVAMHVAAFAPRFLDDSQVDKETLEQEREIFAAQARNEGKPENIIDKIVDGKIKSFYKDNCLVDQPYAQDPKKSVSQVVSELGDLKLSAFSRINIGSAA